MASESRAGTELLADDAAGDGGAGSADSAPAGVPLLQAVRVLPTELLVLRAARHHEVGPLLREVRLQSDVAGDAAVQLTLGCPVVEAEAGAAGELVAEGAAVAAS